MVACQILVVHTAIIVFTLPEFRYLSLYVVYSQVLFGKQALFL